MEWTPTHALAVGCRWSNDLEQLAERREAAIKKRENTMVKTY